MRYTRAANANTVTAQYQVVAPASAANADWVNFPNINGGLDLNPSSGARRDAAGSRIGLIAQDNWPAGGTYPSNGTPAIAHVDYFRVTPDNCPAGADTTAPTTAATTAPAAPNGSNGWFTSDVNVTLTGTDNAGGSGIEKTEYKVDGGSFATYNAPIAVTTAGTHTIEYRSTDKNGNVEATKTLNVKVDKVTPSTTAALSPALPGPGGTYKDPVTLTLTATDATSGVARTEYQVNAPGAFGAFGAAKLASAAAEYVTYDPANKPSFTAAGNYSIDYRSVDAAGNVEAAKTINFKIVTDTAAPVTTATLDPAAPGAGGTYARAVTVKFAATDPGTGGPAPKTVTINASGDKWIPDTAALTTVDQMTWAFPAETAVFPHDVWVIAPGGTAASATQVTPGLKFPGDPPVSKTFTEAGTWTFLCKVHSVLSNGTYTGMVGTADVTAAPAGDAPSGVDYTEYRVNSGDWVKGTSVTVSDEADYTVEYRSADKAGNVEAAKSVAFKIDLPVERVDGDADRDGDGDATATATATPATPQATPAPAAPDRHAGSAGAQAGGDVHAVEAVQDHGRALRHEGSVDSGDLHRRDERSGDGHGGPQDQEGAEAEVGHAGEGHPQVHRAWRQVADAEAVLVGQTRPEKGQEGRQGDAHRHAEGLGPACQEAHVEGDARSPLGHPRPPEGV